MLTEAGDIDERPMLYPGLLIAFPSKVEQAARYELASKERPLVLIKYTLRRGLEQIEGAVFVYNTFLHKVVDVLHTLFRSKSALKDVAIRHLYTNLGACVVSFLFLLLQLNTESVAELFFLCLILKESEHSTFLIIVSDAGSHECCSNRIMRADLDASTTRVYHLCSSRALVNSHHFVLSRSHGCFFGLFTCGFASGSLFLTLLHHLQELVSIHLSCLDVRLLVIDRYLTILHCVLKLSLALLANRIDLGLLPLNLVVASLRSMCGHCCLA